MLFETGENSYGYIPSESDANIFTKNPQEFTVTFYGMTFPLELESLYLALKNFPTLPGEIHIQRKVPAK